MGVESKGKRVLLLFTSYTLCQTFEYWTRVLAPFTQWQLEPRPTLFEIMVLNTIGAVATLSGTFINHYLVILFFFFYLCLV